MYGCASTRYESVLGQYRYRSIHSSSRYFMKVSGQIQDPAALAPEKNARTKRIGCWWSLRGGFDLFWRGAK